MNSIPEHCTWYQCDDAPSYRVSNKLGTLLGYNCVKHAPLKNTKDYTCEPLNDSIKVATTAQYGEPNV